MTIDNRIEKRSPKAGPNLVDLSDYYDTSLDDDWFQHPGHDLQDVPRGVQVLGGTPFDVRGLIQLAGSKSLDVTGVVFPEAVKGIKVNRKGQRSIFCRPAARARLRGSSWESTSSITLMVRRKACRFSTRKTRWIGGLAPRTGRPRQPRKCGAAQIRRPQHGLRDPFNQVHLGESVAECGDNHD